MYSSIVIIVDTSAQLLFANTVLQRIVHAPSRSQCSTWSAGSVANRIRYILNVAVATDTP